MPIAQTLTNTLLLMSALAPAAAQDKSAYSLFNPTPVAQMREMTTDRPDQTESPFTVDAGHVQVEMDFWNHTVDHDSATNQRTLDTALAPVNLKVGLTNAADLQIVLEPYRKTLTRDLNTGAVLDQRHGNRRRHRAPQGQPLGQ